MLGLISAALMAVAADPCVEGEGDRSFRTCFDPGRGLEVTAGSSARGLSGGLDLGLSVRLRADRDSRSKAGTTWLHQHRVAIASARLSDAERTFGLTAYEGVARRHVDEGFLLLPTSPPVRVPFPLDVGLFARVARYERRVEEGSGWSLETVRVAMLLDPLRSGSGRFHLGVGPALSHLLRHDGTSLRHELTPLTALQLVVNAESDDGRWVFRAGGHAGWTFDPVALQSGGAFRVRGEATLERVLLAVNDHPVSLQLRAAGAFADAGALRSSEWSLGGALKLQLFSTRG